MFDKWSERLPLTRPKLGTWPATQACALSGNLTGDLLVCRPALNPLSHTSQGAVFSHSVEGENICTPVFFFFGAYSQRSCISFQQYHLLQMIEKAGMFCWFNKFWLASCVISDTQSRKKRERQRETKQHPSWQDYI